MTTKNLALFDLDNTLLSGDSDHQWTHFLIAKGVLDQASYEAKNEAFFRDYQQGKLDMAAYLAFVAEPLTHFDRPTLNAMHADYLKHAILPMITQKARDLVDSHKAHGDDVLIVTATNRFITEPIAHVFGVEHLIACELEEDAQGRFTGKALGIPSFREGKITRVEYWLASQGKTFSDYPTCYFYSDSFNDLPLLLKVNHPVAVNPDQALGDYAERHGWPILNLREDCPV